MGEVIGQVLSPAVGVALSPLPIVGVILMLLSERARINGPAFVLGWVGGMAIVITVVVALVNPDDLNDADEDPTTLTGVIHLALGVLLLLLALKQWNARPKDGAEADLPKWMAGIDKVSPIAAIGLGAFLSGLNPKNLIFDIAAGTAIAAGDLTTSEQIIAAIVFIVVASVSVAGPVIWYLVAGASAKTRLDSMRGWLVQHNAAIMCVLFLVLGVQMIGKSLPAFF